MLAPCCVSSSRSRTGGAGAGCQVPEQPKVPALLLSPVQDLVPTAQGCSALQGCDPRTAGAAAAANPCPCSREGPVPHPPEGKETPGATTSIHYKDKPFPPTISRRKQQTGMG